MRGLIRLGLSIAGSACALVAASPAAAQSAIVARVSQNGVDSGNCASAPCRTFSYAFSQTATNGQIICIDSGSFGAVTITRSVTIDCAGVNAVAGDNSAGDAITINDGATGSPGTISVTIRNLTLNGFGISRHGINFQSGFTLTVESVAITNFSGLGSNASGIFFAPSRAARLYVANSLITNSGQDFGQGSGIRIVPTGTGYAGAVLENVQLNGNRTGILVEAANTNSSSTNVVINRSVISGSTGSGFIVNGGGGTPGAGVTVTNSTINANAAAGITAGGPLAQIRVENSTIAGNSTGVQANAGAIIASYGNNSLIGNGVNGSFNGFPSEN